MTATDDERGTPSVEAELLDFAEKSRVAISLANADLPDCPLVFVNTAFSKMTGYDAEDCVGRNCRFLQGRNTGQIAAAEVRAFLDNPAVDHHRVVLLNERATGEVFRNMLSLARLTDRRGQTRYFFASQFDLGAASADDLQTYETRLAKRFDGAASIAREHEMMMRGSFLSLADGMARVARARYLLSSAPD